GEPKWNRESNSREGPASGDIRVQARVNRERGRYNFEGIEEVSTNSVARIGAREPKGMDTAEIRKLSDLLELSRTLSSTLNLKAALARVLEILEENHRTLSGGIMLLDESTGELVIEAASGIDSQTARRTRYKVGEGITGRVVQSGKPVVVPQVSREPLFLNRTGVLKKSGRDEATFICVPIAADGRTVGALGVALPYEADEG